MVALAREVGLLPGMPPSDSRRPARVTKISAGVCEAGTGAAGGTLPAKNRWKRRGLGGGAEAKGVTLLSRNCIGSWDALDGGGGADPMASAVG